VIYVNSDAMNIRRMRATRERIRIEQKIREEEVDKY
jgi:hypothetical protein